MREGSAIAKLEMKRGNIKYKPENVVSWYKASRGQDFFQGDYVSTGPNSKASIIFKSGEKLELEEDSQVEIKISRGSNKAVKVTILKGYVVANGSKKSQVIVKTTDGKKYVLKGSQDRVCLDQEADGSASLKCLKKGKKVIKKKVKYIPKLVTIPNKKIMVIEDKEKPNLAKGLESKIINPLSFEQFFWFTQSITEPNLAMTIQVRAPIKAPSNWKPILELLDANGKSQGIFVEGREGVKNQTLNIPVEKIFAVASEIEVDGIIEYRFKIRAGASVYNDEFEVNDESFSSEQYIYRIRSLADLKSGVYSVNFRKFIKGDSRPKYFIQNMQQFSPVGSVDLKMDRKYIASLFPVFKAEVFEIKKSRLAINDGIYIANDIQVIGSLGGKTSSDIIKKIRDMLDADLIYEGGRKSFFSPQGHSLRDFRRWMKKKASSTDEFYILRGKNIYPVSRNFLSGDKQVLKFVGNNAEYIFSSKVKILEAKDDGL